MNPDDGHKFTALLVEWRNGNREAGEVVMAIIYQELRRLAQHYLQNERKDHTLQATALVNEAYLRLFNEAEIEFQNRAHFFTVIGRQMRRILIDYGRSAHAQKRAGGYKKISLEEADGLTWQKPEELMALEEALRKLEGISPRAAQIVDLRFFCGLNEKEAADVLNISLATLKREWSFAKSFIYRQLTAQAGSGTEEALCAI